MPRIAANALVCALIVLAVSLVYTACAFVTGWFLTIEPLLVSLVLGGALLVGLFGTVGFTCVLLAQTLLRRVHWRYLVAVVIVVSLWFVPRLLPSPYIAGIAAAMQSHGLTDDSWVAFAVASRFEPDRDAIPGFKVTSSLCDAHRAVCAALPPYARIDGTRDYVDIRWGGVLVGRRGIRVFDGPVPAERLADGDLPVYRRVSPHVYVYYRAM